MADSKRTFRYLSRVHLLFILATITCIPSYAANLAVLYPESPPPYKQVFEQIISGIQKQHSDKIVRYPLSREFDKTELLSKLKNDNIDMVVTLGRRSFSMIDSIKPLFPFVSGALPLRPGNISGVSLITNPKNLFEQLEQLSPSTRKIHVVHTPHNDWLIDAAKQSTKGKNLKLINYRVDTIADAVKQYRSIIQSADKQDAIWLPIDRVTANEKVILPLLLRECWEKKIVLFSSKPSHVKRGSLFSLYPNNEASGVRLAKMVQRIYSDSVNPGVVTSESSNVGVNLRTARHLGLEYSPKVKQTFYLTFPKP